LWSFAACGNQGEGERCDKANYDADCDDGLTCTPVVRGGLNYGICCLPGNTDANPACISEGTGSTTGSKDAGPDGADSASTDATSD
jgi:hypothetical protein